MGKIEDSFKKIRHYILDGKKVVPSTLLEWAEFLEKERGCRIVKQTNIQDVHVSTVFIGLDHNYLPEGPPQIFETMIFGGEHDGETYRYSTWKEAEEGHHKACELVVSLDYKI